MKNSLCTNWLLESLSYEKNSNAQTVQSHLNLVTGFVAHFLGVVDFLCLHRVILQTLSLVRLVSPHLPLPKIRKTFYFDIKKCMMHLIINVTAVSQEIVLLLKSWESNHQSFLDSLNLPKNHPSRWSIQQWIYAQRTNDHFEGYNHTFLTIAYWSFTARVRCILYRAALPMRTGGPSISHSWSWVS